MKPSALDPIRLTLAIHALPTEPIGADSARTMVREFAEAQVQCPKHPSPVGEIRARLDAGKAIVDVKPCCRRTTKGLQTQLRRLKALGDDRVPDVVPPGHRLVRPGDPTSATPAPFVPFATTGTRRAVSREVAALYAQAGRLQHISTLNGGERVEVYTSETAEEEMHATGVPDGKVPPCNPENIRIRTKKLIAEATKLALREGRPLSDYASFVDWDTQYMRVDPARTMRKLFVEAGDVPNLVAELDANSGETLLVFIFANNRYDRTMRITGRGFVVGHAGEA